MASEETRKLSQGPLYLTETDPVGNVVLCAFNIEKPCSIACAAFCRISGGSTIEAKCKRLGNGGLIGIIDDDKDDDGDGTS